MANFFQKARYFLFLIMRRRLEKIPWKVLNLFYITSTNLKIYITNRADWETYNEIFVRGDYNEAINKALTVYIAQPNKQPFKFLDLGANVGTFTIKVLDSILKKDPFMNFEGILVEGSPKVFHELQRRIDKTLASSGKIKLINGLAGLKNGTAKIFEMGNHIGNSVYLNSSIREKIGSGAQVSYTDISLLYQKDEQINLLKGDIEGSELDFIQNYQDVLLKTYVAVFEFHHLKCDTQKCVELLSNYGFINRRVLFQYGDTNSIEVFWK